MRVQFYGLLFDLAAGWVDATGDLPAGSPPTLVRPTGVGALQFSVARYSGGKHPHVSLADLQDMMGKHCEGLARDFGSHTVSDGDIDKVGCVSFEHGETMAMWYLSNGRDVVLVTYCAMGTGDPEISKELAESKLMVETIDF
ncbi:hypothetical protein EDC40_103647 [Aminobacter aminovorans]|uniref:Uncharacterized protein n=1 Tax=Aminobacter aminovorans TaxID=83263 RepID=A0A380WK64_AMIAI|nr:hypothetical protein [Aminobacter aminovorans]TCS28179.1 hypothetical protein EDC40_103647 [Aminobacter aminovorans]SUU89409.1 Uncharacterised protein [Aminobacter aminovorans]